MLRRLVGLTNATYVCLVCPEEEGGRCRFGAKLARVWVRREGRGECEVRVGDGSPLAGREQLWFEIV